MNFSVEHYSTLGTVIQLLFVNSIYQQNINMLNSWSRWSEVLLVKRAACLQCSRQFLTIIQLLMKYTLVGLAILLLSVHVAQAANNCPNPPLIIPNTFLDNIFDTAFAVNDYQTQLRQFLTNPNMDTARTYITTQSSYLVTLWIFAGLSITLFVAFLIQLCCYNCCGVRKCGRKMTMNSFTPTSVSCSVYIFMFFSLLLMAITITAFIIASDLLANLDDTTCDFNGTFNYLFDGTPVGYTPVWSGADNFNQFAQNLSINFPNTMPTLNAYFQSAGYTQLTNTAPGSLYALATTYACNSVLASNTVSCPFSSATSCANGSSTQTPLFSINYCDANVTTSSAALIAGEETANTTAWQTSLIALKQNIQQVTNSPVSFNDLVSQTSTLSNSIQNMKPGLSSAIDLVHTNFYNSKLGSYITFSIIIFIGLISFLATCCVFCTRNFNCRCLFYPLWLLFTILSILFFLLSSGMMLGSFTLFGGCNAYTYYTTTPGAISSIGNSQTTQVLNTCFNTNPNGSIFSNINNNSLPIVKQINDNYYNSLPSSSFTTVVNSIINTLTAYYVNPNTASLQGAANSTQPQAALDVLNQDANASTFCGPVGSSFQYNPSLCNPNTINPSGNPPCYLINANNSAVSNLSCIANQYQALLSYGSGTQSLASSYMNDVGLQNYRIAYFNYYEALTTFMNSQLQTIFASFLQPYLKLLAGSSCSFLTDSLNSLVNTSCNRDFPEMYAISCLVTAMAGCFFCMMVLSYFLTTRLEFYGFLNGDFTNYDEDAVEEESQMVTIEMADMTAKTNRNQLLTPRK